MERRKLKIENFTKEELWEIAKAGFFATDYIGETLVDLSKSELTKKEAIEKIRDYLDDYDSEIEKYKYV